MAENSDSVRLQLETIRTLTDRPHAYGFLLHLHRLSADDASIIESLALFSPSILPRILSDSHSTDEEIAVMAIKCLGFMLYHPSLIASLSDTMAQSALDSINKLIISTSMKAVCNLGVWCLSIQQLNAPVIESKTNSLINSITYALNNPFGSLSVTYEANQAVIKLTSQIPHEMKQTSEIWAPQIYKRLLSSNKTEYEMAQRCLHKISSVILPPQILLSKRVASDLKRNNMLESMADLVHHEPKKIQALNAWGWFISLLGFDSSENNNLINKMLKIVEKTFTDRDPQVQIATLASWRHLIDAIEPQIINYKKEIPSDDSCRSLLKKIKLILVPLKGIMSSKCHLSVHTCSFNTWCYFLHKLDILINQPLILETAFGSILEVIFSIGAEMPLWNSCIELVHEYILSNVEKNGSNKIKDALLVEYSIKWLHWDLTYLDFHLRIIGSITNVEKMKDRNVENRILAIKAGINIFRSLLKGVKDELKSTKACENMIFKSIESIFKFIKEICDANWCDAYFNHDLKSSFFEGLCEMLVGFIDENNGLFIERIEDYAVSKFHKNAIFSIIGEITIQILEETIDLKNKEGICCNIKNCLALVSRFFKLLVLNLKSNQEDEHIIPKKVFTVLAGLVAQVVLRKDILLFFEVLSDPLSQVMLSCTSTMMIQSLIQNLENLWTHILDCLKRNQHLISFDSSLLKPHSSLFQSALNHPHLPISHATSIFLKSVSQSDKLSYHNTWSFKDFEVLSERFGASTSNKGIKEAQEMGFVSVSTGLKRKRLKITKYTTKGKRLEICKSYGNLIGSKVSLNRLLESRDTRKPEDILQMLKRK